MPKNMSHAHEKQQMGRTFGGSYKFTIGILIGLLVLIVGVALTAYLGGVYSLIFGIPLVVIGLLIPIIAQFAMAERRD